MRGDCLLGGFETKEKCCENGFEMLDTMQYSTIMENQGDERERERERERYEMYIELLSLRNEILGEKFF
jgi:hypothetical protein